MAGFTADFKRLHSREVYPDAGLSRQRYQQFDLGPQANDWTSNATQRRANTNKPWCRSWPAWVIRSTTAISWWAACAATPLRSCPASKNYDWFPSVSGSWKLSSEKFFRNAGLDKVFDLVKFRAGWGRIGNVDLYPNNVADRRAPELPIPDHLRPEPRPVAPGNLPQHDSQLFRPLGNHRADQRGPRPDDVQEQTEHQRGLLPQGNQRPDRLHSSPPNRWVWRILPWAIWATY